MEKTAAKSLFLCMLLIFMCLQSFSISNNFKADTTSFDDIITVNDNYMFQFHRINTNDGLLWDIGKNSLGRNIIWYNGDVLIGNEKWDLEYLKGTEWESMMCYPVKTYYVLSENNRVCVVTREYMDYRGTTFEINYEFRSGVPVKISFDGYFDKLNEYRIIWKCDGIKTDYMRYDDKGKTTRAWDSEDYDFEFNYDDVYQSFGDITDVEIRETAKNYKITHYFYIGMVQGGFWLDPTFGKTNTESDEPVYDESGDGTRLFGESGVILPEPYIYENFTPPPNSFGCGPYTIKRINESFFWNDTFNNNITWTLYYVSKLGNEWVDVTSESLVFDRVRYGTQEKQYVNFTAPNTGYYMLNYTVNGTINDYEFDAANHSYCLNYGIPTSNETYHVVYNWSDIVQSSWNQYIEYSHGVNEQGFWLNVFINTKITANSFLSIDPFFGDDSEYGTNLEFLNNGKSPKDLMVGLVIDVTSSMPAYNITAYISSTDVSATTVNATIYSEDGSTLIAESTSVEVAAGTTAWYAFDLPARPTLYGTYRVGIWGDFADVSNNKLIALQYLGTGGSNTTFYTTAMSTWPSPPTSISCTDNTESEASVYIAYDLGNPPIQSNEYPTNQTTGVALDTELIIRSDDSDNDYIDILIRTNASGSWDTIANYSNCNTVGGYIWAEMDYDDLKTGYNETTGGYESVPADSFASIKSRAYIGGNISNVWIKVYQEWDNGEALKVLIYNSSLVLLGTSEERTDGGTGWIQFNFTTPVDVEMGEYYYIGVFTDTGVYVYDMEVAGIIDGYGGGKYNEGMTYPTPESPIGGWDSSDTSSSCGIYGIIQNDTVSSPFNEYNYEYWWSVNVTDGIYWCNETYSFTTAMMTPEISNPSPVNESTGVSTTPTCSVKVWDNSSNPDALTVKWYENTTEYKVYICDDVEGEGFKGDTASVGTFSDGGESEYSSVEYDRIESIGGIDVLSQGTGSNPYHKYVINIPIVEENLNHLNITIHGYGLYPAPTPEHQLLLYVYNFTGSQWVMMDTHTSDTDDYLYANFSTNLTDYMENYQVEFGTYCGLGIDYNTQIYMDYVEVNVSSDTGIYNLVQTNTSVTSGDTVSYTFDNATGGCDQYWWKVVVNNTENSNESLYTFSTASVLGYVTPEISNPSPVNESTGVSTTPTCSAKVWDNGTDGCGNNLTVNWYESDGIPGFSTLDTYDDDKNFRDIIYNGSVGFAIITTGGVDNLYAFTFDENGTEEIWVKDTAKPDIAAYDICSNDSYIFIACALNGIKALTFDENGTEELWLKGSWDEGVADGDSVWCNESYVFYAEKGDGIRAFYFNGSGFELRDTYDFGGEIEAYTVWGGEPYIYAGLGSNGLACLTFNENGTEEFWLKEINDDGGSNAIYGVYQDDDGYVYGASRTNGLFLYNNSNGDLTYLDTDDQGGDYLDVSGDGTYIYTASTSGGINVYQRTGETLTYIENENFNCYDIFCNSSYIFGAIDTDGFKVFEYNVLNLVQTNNSVSSGDTVYYTFDNATESETDYWWKVSVNNSQNSNESWYKFTTAGEEWSNSAPTFSGNEPTGTGQPLTPNANVTINDEDGNSTTVDWYNSTDNTSWTHFAHYTDHTANTSNGTTCSFATSYNTKYYLKVTANDTHDNSTRYWNFTTSAETLDIVIIHDNAQTIADYYENWKEATTDYEVLSIDKDAITANSTFWVNGTWGDNNPSNPWYISQSIGNYEKYNDTQAKVRNYIRYMKTTYDISYVILFGTTEVPVRYFYHYTLGQGFSDMMYYGCLNGTQNPSDGATWTINYQLASLSDVDIDVIVARFPVNAGAYPEYLYNIINKSMNWSLITWDDIQATTVGIYDESLDSPYGDDDTYWTDDDGLRWSQLGGYANGGIFTFVNGTGTAPGQVGQFDNCITQEQVTNDWVNIANGTNSTVPHGWIIYEYFTHVDWGFPQTDYFSTLSNSSCPFFCFGTGCGVGDIFSGDYQQVKWSLTRSAGGLVAFTGNTYEEWGITYERNSNYYNFVFSQNHTLGEAYRDILQYYIRNDPIASYGGWNYYGDPAITFPYHEVPVMANSSYENGESVPYGEVNISANALDFQGDTITNASLWTNASGDWAMIEDWLSVASGTLCYDVSNDIFIIPNHRYFYSWNVTDGTYWWNQTRYIDVGQQGYITYRNCSPFWDLDGTPDYLNYSLIFSTTATYTINTRAYNSSNNTWWTIDTIGGTDSTVIHSTSNTSWINEPNILYLWSINVSAGLGIAI